MSSQTTMCIILVSLKDNTKFSHPYIQDYIHSDEVARCNGYFVYMRRSLSIQVRK